MTSTNPKGDGNPPPYRTPPRHPVIRIIMLVLVAIMSCSLALASLGTPAGAEPTSPDGSQERTPATDDDADTDQDTPAEDDAATDEEEADIEEDATCEEPAADEDWWDYPATDDDADTDQDTPSAPTTARQADPAPDDEQPAPDEEADTDQDTPAEDDAATDEEATEDEEDTTCEEPAAEDEDTPAEDDAATDEEATEDEEDVTADEEACEDITTAAEAATAEAEVQRYMDIQEALAGFQGDPTLEDIAEITQEADTAYYETIAEVMETAAEANAEAGLDCFAVPTDTDTDQDTPAEDDAATDEEATEDEEDATSEVHYYAYDTPNVNFGPSVEADTPDAAYAEMQIRTGRDPMLAVTTAEALQILPPMTMEQREEATKVLAANPDQWDALLAQIDTTQREAAANGKFRLEEECGDYTTEYATDGTNGVPQVYNDEVDAPCFTVLVINDARFKLSCGFQPVWLDAAQAAEKAISKTPSVDTPSGNPSNPGSPDTPNTPCITDCVPPPVNNPKDPTQNVNLNPAVPPAVQGPGTTPVGEDPGPVVEPPAPGDDDGYAEGEEPQTNDPVEPAPEVESGANGDDGVSGDGVVVEMVGAQAEGLEALPAAA